MRLRWIAAVLSLLAASASAQSRPTSDHASLLGGRTLGNAEVLLAGALGWPGFWAEAAFAPSSRFNIGLRLAVDYGSPLLGFGTGVGGTLGVPMRLHVYGARDIDVALAAQPFGALGEGALVGQRGVFRDDFGWGLGLELGVRAGFHVSDAVTLLAGGAGIVAFTRVDDADASQWVGGPAAIAGIEAVMSRATMLFAELWAGYGFAEEGTFDGRAILRVSFGVAYRL